MFPVSSYYPPTLSSPTPMVLTCVKDAVRSHRSFFGSDPEPATASPQSMGTAAAMQALKLFNNGASQGKSTSQSAFIALAMAEASKLFDNQASQGKVEGGQGSKESAVMKAGEMALKMYLKSQQSSGGGAAGGSGNALAGLAALGGLVGGGSGDGGQQGGQGSGSQMSGLLGMASKFMK